MENKATQDDIRVFQDSIGRLLIGELVGSTPKTWTVKNPLILHVQTVNNQISIQFFPIMFKEFQADKDEYTEWTYQLTNITPCSHVTIDARLRSQYKNIFAPVASLPPMMNTAPQAAPQAPVGDVVKLFDN